MSLTEILLTFGLLLCSLVNMIQSDNIRTLEIEHRANVRMLEEQIEELKELVVDSDDSVSQQ